MPLHKRIQHALLPGLLEFHRQLVAVDRGDAAVAEFLVEDALAGAVVSVPARLSGCPP